MDHKLGLAGVAALGIGAQWLAWKLRLPAILLLLLSGLAVGPLLGWLDPDLLLGDLLLPLVSLSVALILFEGGLSLRLGELHDIGHVVRNLVTVGALISCLGTALAAWAVLGFEPRLALLVGAIGVVTGPTVIVPLLRHVRVAPPLGPLLRWEGIVIDPVGAVLAVIVFEGLLVTRLGEATAHAASTLAVTLLAGGAIGLLAAGLLVLLLSRGRLPDYLDNPVALAVVLGAFVLSDSLQEESGLLAVTVAGVALANQRKVVVKHIVEFKENLRTLLISGLFVLLAARIEPERLRELGLPGLAFVALLIVAVRPASVLVSCLGSKLDWRQRAFLAGMAPRGIVAAAVASVFGIKLAEAGVPGAEALLPVVFLLILASISVYGLLAAPLARLLAVGGPEPQGALIVGAHPWARDLAQVLGSRGLRVVLVDSNWSRVAAARLAGLEARYGSALSETLTEELDFEGLGRLLALTPNDAVNALAAQRFAEYFGQQQVYQLVPRESARSGRESIAVEQRGRLLFGAGLDYDRLQAMYDQGMRIKGSKLTEEHDLAAFRERYGESAVPLCVLRPDGRLEVVADDGELDPPHGSTLLALVLEPVEPTPRREPQAD